MLKKAIYITTALSIIPTITYANTTANNTTDTNAVKQYIQEEKNKINTQLDQVKKDIQQIDQQKDQLRQDVKNKTDQLRQSINQVNNQTKTNVSEKYTETKNNNQTNNKTIIEKVKEQQARNLTDTPLLKKLKQNNSTPIITIAINDQPVTINKDWFTKKQQAIIEKLKTKLNQGKIDDNKIHLEVLQLLHQNLKNYIQQHEKIDIKDLISKGFNISEMNPTLREKLEQLLKKYKDNEISNTKYQHQLLDILNQHLIDTNKKVQHLNDVIKKEQSGADLFGTNIADSISNDLKPDNTVKESIRKTPSKQETQTSFLPITGEMPKEYIVGIIASLLVGVLLLFKKK